MIDQDYHTEIAGQALNLLASKLIDLSKRNRLLNAPDLDPSRRGGLSAVPIIHPDIVEVYDRLSNRERLYKIDSLNPLQPSLLDGEAENPLPQNSHALYSNYPVKQLHAALSNMRDRGRASIDERGVNILFAAIGFIEWDDPVSKDDHWRAPLILVPVTVEKKDGDFSVAGVNDEVLLNPALVQKFSTEYGIQLPALPDEPEREEMAEFIANIEIELEKRKKVFHDQLCLVRSVSIGIFSFAKIAMFRELTQLGVQKLMEHNTIASLVDTKFDYEWADGGEENPDLDSFFEEKLATLVVEADSSQLEAVYRSQTGRNLAIQGPPGTGKSQTIVNLIADALARDQTVLFVAEKRVALDVVYRRLKQAGLGNGCLVIHPGKTQTAENGGTINKKAIVAEIERAWYSTPITSNANGDEVLKELFLVRKRLNDYVAELHRPRFTCQKSFYEIFGNIERTRKFPVVDIHCPDAAALTVNDLRQRQALLDDFEELEEFLITTHLDSPWFVLKMTYPSPVFVSRIRTQLEELNDLELELTTILNALRQRTGLAWPDEFEALSHLANFFSRCRLDLLSVSDSIGLQKRFAGKYAGMFKFLFKSAYREDCLRLQPLWLKDWNDDPRAVAGALADLLKAREIMAINEAFKPSPENTDLSGEMSRLADLIAKIRALYEDLQDTFDLEVIRKLKIGDMASSEALEWAHELLSRLDDISPCLRFRLLHQKPECAPIRDMVSEAARNSIPVLQWRGAYERRIWETLLELAYKESPFLAEFNASSHERIIARFRELDRMVIESARYQVANHLANRKPPITGEASRAASSEVAILLREFHRKRNMPLRKLLSQTHNAILGIKPCMMMSPLTVSQYLDPNEFVFDVVIFDEASQLRMEDSLGSIFRAKQIIVVGDEQQLPPTRFFEAMDSGGDYDEEADQVAEALDYESILTRAEGEPQAFRQVDLRWHYRSRHEELIAFSNKNFYNNRLFTFPNSEQSLSSKAVHFVYVPDGVYDRGRSRTNPNEAYRVAEACLDYAREHPTWSLGVVTFSESQRRMIEDNIESRLQENPDLRTFFAEDREGGEPFMVKNLELIQGDERDAVFFSFGYGKDATGAFTQNFGPLNQEAGRRRLNVAVTRARHLVYLFTSIQPEDLTSDALGVRLMKEYMTLARDGLAALFGSPATGQSQGETESPFEDAVAAKLRARGLEVHSQIGVSGYRIDLGVIDPLIPGRYVVGVECDGAAYHSGRTARDRDRLRQQVLEGLGWVIVRIWSKAWNENPEREINKVLAVVKKYQGMRDFTEPEPLQRFDNNAESEPFVPPSEIPVSTIQDAYPAKFSRFVLSKRRIRNGFTPWTGDDIASMLTEQGPTQLDSLIKQISLLWGYMRVGDSVRYSIRDAVSSAEKSKKMVVTGRPLFVYPAGKYPITIRLSTGGDQRDADEIPLEEYHLALWLAVNASGGSVEVRDAIRIASQVLGFQRLSSNLSERFMEAIRESEQIEASPYSNVDSSLRKVGDRLCLG